MISLTRSPSENGSREQRLRQGQKMEAIGRPYLISQQYKTRIHLLFADVVLPHMTGKELADRLAQSRPEMKVLYMSGYTKDSVVHHGVLDAGIAFLQKPITPDALLRKIREVLDRR